MVFKEMDKNSTNFSELFHVIQNASPENKNNFYIYSFFRISMLLLYWHIKE